MKKFLKNEKGINLVSLTLTVIVLLILTNIIIYNIKGNLGIEKLRSMQSDIRNLKDRVSIFYADFGEIPAKIEYTNITHLKNAGIISQAVDTGKFYVIDLSAIENLTLTYGQDYQQITSSTTSTQANQLKDLYIINETSHNIFYVKGIEIDNEIFYTDYNSDDIDTVAVELKYVDNIKIPEGYTYVDCDISTGINIKNDLTGKTYTWIVVEEQIAEAPTEITVEDGNTADFINSVNTFGGYYKSSDNSAIYITVDEA